MGTICSSASGGHEHITSAPQPQSKSSTKEMQSQSNPHSLETDKEDTPGHKVNGEATQLPASHPEPHSGTAHRAPSSVKPPVPQPYDLEPEVVKLPCLEKLPSAVSRRVCGQEQTEKQPTVQVDKVVRVYHIAHLTDSHDERDILLERVYPELQIYCLEHGFNLDVIDLHWGQRDPYVPSRNLGLTPCQVLRSLIEKDKNVIFVVFLNEKYGSYGCPLRIAQRHLTPILDELPKDEKALIEQWYRLDENSIPPEFVLQPINTHINGYGSSIDKDHKQACIEWSQIMDEIGDVLWTSSEQEFQNLYLKSEFEQELEESVFSERCPADNVILIRRVFTKSGLKSASKQHLTKYTDVKMGKLDKIAQTRLNNLTNRINDKVEPANRVEMQMGWHRGALDREAPEQAQYLLKLCNGYRETVKTALEKTMEEKSTYDKIRVNMVGAGMQKHLYDDILHHTLMYQELNKHVIGQEEVFSQLRSYVIDGHPTGSSQHIRPLVVAGPTGSGKSTMTAHLAARCSTMSGWTKCVRVIRHIGCGPGCQSLDEAIASIGVHVCFLFGLPYTYAHKPVSMFPGSFKQLLNRVPETHPLLIVLDGVEYLNQAGSMEWLPAELPFHVRLVLTVTEGTATHETLKNMPWQNEGYSVSIPDLSSTDASRLLQDHVTNNQRQLTASQMNTLEDAVRANPNPLYIRLVALVSAHWRSYTEKDDLHIGSTIKDVIMKELLAPLEECHGEEPVGRLLTYMSLMEEGISDTEMKDMLSWDEGFLQPVYLYSDPAIRQAPRYFLMDLVSFLQCCLLRISSVGGVVLTKWRHRAMKEIVLDVYKCYKFATWMKVLDYYEGRWANGKQMQYASNDSGVEYLKDRMAPEQPIQYKGSYNQRKLEQISTCLIQNDMFKTLKEEFLVNLENLTHMLASTNLYRVLYGMKQYLDVNEDDADVLFMFDLLRRNASVVYQGSDNLWSRFYLRVKSGLLNVSEFPAIQGLFDALSSGVLKTSKIGSPFLIPSSNGVLDMQDSNQLKQKAVIHGIFTITGDRNHIISVSNEEGEIVVWNIHHQVAVRTLTNLPQPMSLKMINSHRSVVLCNRELRIYNLDEGKEECRLKGVLNLKMPYFGVLDSEHTVALSRNRMYVNIIKNSTGDMEATFKVGEDRFLDSLVMSANGERCVCGDQVQKPFPLLVWDLVNRKLVHDMRIAGHEFVTSMAAITAEGHYVVCVCRLVETDPQDKTLAEPNFLIVYDLQSGSLFKKWKPLYSTTSVQISSASNFVVSGHEDGSVLVWDLIGGALKHRLVGHARGPDHVSVSEDGERAATCDLTCTDPSVRLWDLDKGTCLGSFVTDYGVTSCELSLDGNVVVIGVPGCKKIVCLWASTDDQDRSKMDISIYGDASRNKLSYSMDN